MLEFLVDNMFVVFGGKVFQQIVGIPMGTHCAPLLADIFLYSYEAEFIQSLLSTGKKKLASQFNFTYRYIDDVLSINNPDFENYLGQMYPTELEIKDTTESNTSASYLDLLLPCELITELDFITALTLLPNFGGFHRTLQRVRLANRGRLLLRTPGPVPFGTCICSNIETILS